MLSEMVPIVSSVGAMPLSRDSGPLEGRVWCVGGYDSIHLYKYA